jgi:hypothetical protein
MGVSVFPAPSASGGALPQGATANLASGYAATGGWRYATSTTAGNYQVQVQAPSNRVYGIETANGVTENEIAGGQTVPLSLASTEASITVGSYYPLERAIATGINGAIRGINGNGTNLFVAATSTGYVYTSTDSLTWTNRTSGYETVSQSFNSVGYVNDRFVIMGWSNGTTSVGILHSTNGTTWSFLDLSSLGASGRPMGLTFGGGTWVVSFDQANTSAIASSTSFTTGWAVRTTPTTNIPYTLAYGAWKGTNYFIAGCSGGVTFYSTDGATWSNSQTINNGADIYSIIYANGRFLAYGLTSTAPTVNSFLSVTTETSSNDITTLWTTVRIANQASIGTTLSVGGYIYGMYLLFSNATVQSNSITSKVGNQSGDYAMLTSRDGFTWTVRQQPLQMLNLKQLPLKQANGIVATASAVQWNYQTTAYNKAAIHINSTALASV